MGAERRGIIGAVARAGLDRLRYRVEHGRIVAGQPEQGFFPLPGGELANALHAVLAGDPARGVLIG
jgi:hypothetical protein